MPRRRRSSKTTPKISHYRIPVDEDRVHVIEFAVHQTKPSPAIISIHGTGGPGYGDRRWRLRLARRGAAMGFRFYLFDSRGTGYSDGEFEDWTVSKFVEDTVSVLRWVRKQPLVSTDKIGLFGFSLGSAVAVLVAAQEQDSVSGIVAYTLPCDMDRGFLWYFERFAPRSLDELYKSGRVWLPPLGNYLKRSFLDDLPKHDVKKEISTLKIPLLLIQPDDDDQVPWWVSRQAFEVKPSHKRVIHIRGTHTMHQPTRGWDEYQEKKVIRLSLRWFRTILR